MYLLSRPVLILTVALLAYSALLGITLGVMLVPPERRGLTATIVTACVLAVLARRKGRRAFTAFGTAAWASTAELQRAGMLTARKGLTLGRVPADCRWPLGRATKALLNRRLGARDACREFFDTLNRRKRKQGRLVRLPQAVHTVCFAPTRAGKGVSLVVPFLQTDDESCVVIDPKGELSLITSAARKAMGHRIVILDPYKVVAPKLRRKPDTYNDLDFIHPDDPLALDHCRDLAGNLVIRTGEEKDPHWNDSAEAVIASVIAVVVMYGQKDQGKRSLQDARDILAHPQKFDIARKLMLEHGGMLARWGGQLGHLKGDEFASVMSTCNRHMRFLDTLAIAESTAGSSFDPSGPRRGRGRMTVYLVLPPEHMRAQSPLLRMWIGGMFRAAIRGGLGEARKINFVLDEAAALGHMAALDDAVDKYAGYGVRLQFFYQSLGQLKKCWPDDQGQTLLSNATKIFFGTTEPQTAEFISKCLGPETVVVESGGSNSGWSQNRGSSSGSSYSQSSGSSYSGGSSSNWQQQRRDLLLPDEIIALDPRIAITLTPGVRPLWTRLVRYYEEKRLFKPSRWWRRMAAACWTFMASAALLTIVGVMAAALTIELREVIEQEQKRQAPPAVYQPPPVFIPR